MKGLIRLEHLERLDQIRTRNKWERIFYARHLGNVGKKTIKELLEDIKSPDGDVNLQIFFLIQNILENISRLAMVYMQLCFRDMGQLNMF